MQAKVIQAFQQTVYDYYGAQGRHDLPWRSPEADSSFDPYKILVSELMLQQTQVGRVLPKYIEFLDAFPTVSTLAAAELGEVLRTWNGLGYNRRAKFLHQAAQLIMTDFQGEFPRTLTELTTLPGVGPNTAGAIMAYAFNEPAVFIETNIRTVFIHHFFADQHTIADAEILALVRQTLDAENARIWYWSLMDYGTFLKQRVGNLNHASKSYAKQSRFHGSRRQIRGQIIRLLTERELTLASLKQKISDDRLESVLDELVSESLVTYQANRFRL